MTWEVLFISLTALTLIVISTSQFVGQGIAAGRVAWDEHRRRTVDMRGLRQAAEIVRLNSELQASPSTALPWRVMEVAQVVDEASDCRSYYLVDAFRQTLPTFRPGQHLLVRPALAGAYQTTRCYSLSSPPDVRYWRITVKRQPLSAGPDPKRPDPKRPDPKRHSGGLSHWLHDTIGAGDCLLVGGPNGHFSLSEDDTRPLVLLAAGVGITPMASMLAWSRQHTPQRPASLVYQAQDLEHWPLGPEVHRLADELEFASVISYFSRLSSDQLSAAASRTPGKLLSGKFSVVDLALTPGQPASDYYLCGPTAWMESLRRDLLSCGVDPQRIHWESFGSASPLDSATSASVTIGPNATSDKASVESSSAGTSLLAADQSSTTWPVRFEHSGIDASWSDPTQTLWELARQHRVEIASGCLSGACGSCRVKLLAGQVEYDRPVAVELVEGECLTCIARPCTPCVLDA